MESGDTHGALALLEEATIIYSTDRTLLFEKARIHRALGNFHEAHKDEVHAMDLLYLTESKVTDEERIKRTDPFDNIS